MRKGTYLFLQKFTSMIVVASSTLGYPSTASSQSLIDGYLSSLKETSLIDDATIEDEVLVVWPAPNLQINLDYESLGVRLCAEHKRYRYLVVWFMDSSLYRKTKEMELLESRICIK